MADSKSEKQGMTVLGFRLSDNVEHVPIKKRRFLCRSASPPPSTSLSYPGESEGVTRGEHVSSQKFHSEEVDIRHDSSCISDVDHLVNKEVNVDACKSEKITDQVDAVGHLPNVSVVTSSDLGNNSEGITKRGVLESVAILDTSLSLLTELSARGDEHSAKVSTQASGSCTTGPLTEVVASCSAKNPFTRNLSDGENVDFLYLPGNSENVSHTGTVDVTVSSQDHRLHWDLNLEMDAWERPLDCQHFDPRTTVEGITFKDVKNEMDCLKSRNLGVYDCVQMKLGLADYCNEKVELPCFAGGFASGSRKVNLEELPNKDTTPLVLDGGLNSNTISVIYNSDGCNPHPQFLLNQDCCPSQIVGPSLCSGVTSLSSLQISSSDSCTDHSVLSKCQHSSTKFALDGQCKSCKNVGGPPDVHGDRSGSKEVVVVGENPSRTESLDRVIDDRIHRLSDAASLDNCMLKVSVDHCDQASHQVQIKVEQTTSMSSGNSAAVNENPYSSKCHDVADITCSNDLVNSSDKLANCENSENYNSDFSQNDAGIGTEVSEVQADYDSQYEDGELRESYDYAWKEYAVRDSVGHDGSHCNNLMSLRIKEEENSSRSYADRNNLVSDGDVFMNAREVDVTMEKTTSTGSSKEQVIRHSQPYHGARYLDKESTVSAATVKVEETKGIVHGESLLTRYQNDGKNFDQSARTREIFWEHFLDRPNNYSDKFVGIRYRKGKNNNTDDWVNETGSKDTETKIVEFRARRRELQSYMSGRLNRDLSPRKDRLHSRGYRRDSYPAEFVKGSRYSPHTYKDECQHNHVSHSDGNDSLGRRHSYSYDGPDEVHYQERRNSVTNYGKLENDSLVVAGSNVSEPIGLGSRRIDRLGDRLVRRRSPAVMNETFNVHVRRLTEDVNCDGYHRSYGRSGPRFYENDYKRRYHAPPSDDWTHSSRNSSLGGRIQKFSPVERNDYSRSRRSKSPSRLRTHHLNDSQSPKGRGRSDFLGNSYSRHRSRSPDLTKQGRMRRVGSSPQRHGFLEDNMAGSRSMSRRLNSPQHYSKWNGNRNNDDVSHFRKLDFSQRVSSIKQQNLPHGETLDYRYSMRKERPNDHFSTAPSRRFSRENNVARGGSRHCDNDDDSAHGHPHALVGYRRDQDIDGAKKPVRHVKAVGLDSEQVSQNKDAADLHDRGRSLH